MLSITISLVLLVVVRIVIEALSDKFPLLISWIPWANGIVIAMAVVFVLAAIIKLVKLIKK